MLLRYAIGGNVVYTLEDLWLVGGPPDPILSHLVKMSSRACGAESAMFNIWHKDRSKIQCQAHCCLEAGRAEIFPIPERFSLTRLVCQRNMVVAIDDALEDDRVSRGCGANELEFRAMMGAPVLGPDGEPVGSLNVCSKQPKTWSDVERDSIFSMAALASQHVLLRATIATVKILRDESGVKTA